MTSYLFVTRPEFDPEQVEIGEDGSWSCSKTTKAGDRLLVYVAGRGIQFEWRARSDAVPDPDWRYVCDVDHVRTLDPPITIAELRDAVSKQEWAPPYQNFRGLRSVLIPASVADVVVGMRQDNGVDPARPLSEFCIYTIASRDRLDPVALEQGPFDGQEARLWKTGLDLWYEADTTEHNLPILFADAKDCSRLLYWGIVEAIDLRKGTNYFVDRLRPLPGRRTPQELVLRSTGARIAPGFIRPYAICRTPDFLDLSREGPVLAQGEGPSEGSLVEGAAIQVTVNAFERSPEARRQCIAYHGCRCSACGLDFARTYGRLGVGYIEVHHLKPLSEMSGEYTVDPVRDLRPVCPNCHAMVHRRQPPLTIEELSAALSQAAEQAGAPAGRRRGILGRVGGRR